MRKVSFVLVALFSMLFGKVDKGVDGGLVVVTEDNGKNFPLIMLTAGPNDYGIVVVGIATNTTIEYNEEVGGRPCIIRNAYNDNDYIATAVTESERYDNGIIIYDVDRDADIIRFLKRVKSVRVSILSSIDRTGVYTTNSMSVMGFTRLLNSL